MKTIESNTKLLNDLDTFLKGTNMGLDAFEKYIHKAESPEIKAVMQKIYNMYRRHSALLNERIIEVGGSPSDGVGIIGKLAEIYEDIKHIGVNSDSELLEIAFQSCKTGFTMGEKFIEEHEYLDETTMSLIKDLVRDNEECLNLIGRYQGK